MICTIQCSRPGSPINAPWGVLALARALTYAGSILRRYGDPRRPKLPDKPEKCEICGCPPEKWLTVAEVATVLRRSPGGVRLMILQGEINVTGVLVPIIPEIYKPVLAELAAMGISFQETVETL